MDDERLSTDERLDQLAQVLRYHEETKHHFFRYARALGYLDWANQPDPFRRFEGAPLVPLPVLKPDEAPRSPLYEDLYRDGAVAIQPVSLRTISRFMEYALALSAWKQVGSTRWALRSNPSSGNLHPTEGYLLLSRVPGFTTAAGLYHYASKEHGLELRAEYVAEIFSRLMNPFPRDAFLLGLTSICWREAWKYGERAFRYCQHDAGHAIGTARIAAATLGWRMLVLDDMADDTLDTLLGLNRLEDFKGAEREHPDCIAVVWPAGTRAEDTTGARVTLPLSLDPDVVQTLARAVWHGRANRLSHDTPVPWEIIDVVSHASRKTETDGRVMELRGRGPAAERSSATSPYPGQPLAGQVIRQRRSAVAFDGVTSISADSFFTMLSRVMPRVERRLAERPMPWDVIPWEPTIHLALFVHRVDGLANGLYMLVRDRSKVEPLREAMHGEFAWTAPPTCPAELPLFLLVEGDARRSAVQVSCHQEIAGDSAFSLGMIAEFEETLQAHGPWIYRRLFWETGLIGQVLYLEAEAAGVRATGIGCFFDDPMHQVLGLQGTTFQSLYHFTTGGHVDDPRLTTLPPYGER